MLPTDIDKFFPAGYERDSSMTALASKIDLLITNVKGDIVRLATLKDPLRINADYLDDVGDYLEAGIIAGDTERQKRLKIREAVAGHKRRGSWTIDAKPKIDAIAGGDSQIFRATDQDDWILVGDGDTPSAFYWAALGADGIDDQLGIALIGSGLEVEVAGNIYIDVDNAALTADEQENIRLTMLDIVPVYMKVHFGYVNVSDQFVEYFIMG